MSRVLLGLGSNVGEKEKNIERALELLQETCEIVKISSLYKTKPMYYEDQDWFVNAVVEIQTDMGPHDLHAFVKDIENRFRTKTFKNGPREIDIDILFYDDLVIETETLMIPHPRIQERAFVLTPLAEIAPDFIHPVLHTSVQEMLDKVSDKGSVEKL